MNKFDEMQTAAMMSAMRTLAAVVSALMIIGLAFLAMQRTSPPSANILAVVSSPKQSSADPPRIAPPERLVIPSIHVNAPVEDVGLLSDGSMDAPKGWNDVAWYDGGPRPGEAGNAVIAGHLDSYTGTAVFWNLKKLKPGDGISVIDTTGASHMFRVTSMHDYATINPPMRKIFGTASGAHLNLITCGGTWNKSLQRYNERLVVYADAAQ